MAGRNAGRTHTHPLVNVCVMEISDVYRTCHIAVNLCGFISLCRSLSILLFYFHFDTERSPQTKAKTTRKIIWFVWCSLRIKRNQNPRENSFSNFDTWIRSGKKQNHRPLECVWYGHSGYARRQNGSAYHYIHAFTYAKCHFNFGNVT